MAFFSGAGSGRWCGMGAHTPAPAEIKAEKGLDFSGPSV